MRKCPYCSREVDNAAVICPHCKAALLVAEKPKEEPKKAPKKPEKE